MADYGGFIYGFDEPKRADLLRQRLTEFESDTFTDVVSDSDFRLKQAELFVCSLDGTTVELAALVRRSVRVATGKVRIRFTDLVPFDPLPLSEIDAALSAPIKKYFSLAKSGKTCRLPPKTWGTVWERLKQARPSAAAELDRIEQLRRHVPLVVSGPTAPILAQERDAAMLALRFAGHDPSDLLTRLRWTEGLSIFTGIASVGLLEDQMIKHDASIFSNWELVAQTRVGETIFRSESHVVTIMDVNRTAIEHTLGVDLLYYVRPQHTFLMIQYKRMVKEEDGVIGYRPDDQCTKEVNRMLAFVGGHSDDWDGTAANYRLSRMPFYMKLCPKETFDPTSKKMLNGIYLPLDLWRAMCESPDVVGPRGGVRFTYNNTPARLNTDQFVHLVQTGLVGSSGATTDDLRELVRESLSMAHSVVIAEVDEEPAKPDTGDRERTLDMSDAGDKCDW